MCVACEMFAVCVACGRCVMCVMCVKGFCVRSVRESDACNVSHVLCMLRA
jgi:hypothetical protein